MSSVMVTMASSFEELANDPIGGGKHFRHYGVSIDIADPCPGIGRDASGQAGEHMGALFFMQTKKPVTAIISLGLRHRGTRPEQDQADKS